MSRKIALFCALIGVLAFVAMPAYAEVQNIRVSGDIQALGVYRDNYDLEDEGWRNPAGLGLTPMIKNAATEDEDSLFMSIVRLRVDADLTDNVAACVRLANAREWDVAEGASDDIILDLAYITLKEMLYSPLTMTIGRQELNYGDGLILGHGRYQDHTANAITYDDLMPFHGYDAVRAVLDYDPWTLDLIMAKIQEADDDADTDFAGADTAAGQDSDTDLYGLNLGYRFDQYDAEMEGYFFMKRDENWNYRIDTVNAAGDRVYSRLYEENDVYTLGLRGSCVPLENLTLSGEFAAQLGEIRDDTSAAVAAQGNNATVDGNDIGGDTSLDMNRDREALAINVAGKYDFADIRFNPMVGVEYLYLSGEEADQSGDYEEWDEMYRGKVMGTIRDRLERISAAYDTNDNLDSSGWTNQHTIKACGSVDLGELVDGLSLNLAYLHYWFAEEPLPDAEDDIGDEINMNVTYDYTEDVQFAVDSSWFMPGDYYERLSQGTGIKGRARAQGATNRVSDATAVSIVASCKVTF
jgi:hypothetical protein